MPSAVETVKARLRVHKPQTLLEQAVNGSIHGETRAVVYYSDTKEAIFLFRTNFDLARSGARSDGVADSVFDDGLKNEVGDERVQSFRVNENVRGETILKAYALDFQIAAQEFHLLFERDFLCARVFQREAQEISETRNHLARGFCVLVQ